MWRSTRPSKAAAIGPSGPGDTRIRRRLSKRLRDEPVRSPPALAIAGDGDRHQLVGREHFLQLEELLAHFARVAVHQAGPLLVDVGALLPRVAVRQALLDARHGRVDAFSHVEAPKVHARRETLGLR